MTAPVSPIATRPFWVVERVLYLDGWEKGRPVYVMNGLRPDDHAYSQDIEHAKQFPTKDDAAAYLRDNLRDNEAFEIHEHMMVAPPTATQETPEQMADWIVERCPLPVNDTIGRGWLRKAVADTVKDALSSAERRIEGLVRERDEANEPLKDTVNRILDEHSAWIAQPNPEVASRIAFAAAVAVSVQFETRPDPELYVPGEFRCAKCGFTLSQFRMRADDGAIGSRDEPGERCPNDGALLWRVTWKQRAADHYERAAEEVKSRAAAESRLASLTGQVEEMRTALVLAEDILSRNGAFSTASSWITEGGEVHPMTAITTIRAAIRSLPVLPTTGDGGGPNIASLRQECASSGFHEHDGCSCSDAELVARAPTGRETSGEET